MPGGARLSVCHTRCAEARMHVCADVTGSRRRVSVDQLWYWMEVRVGAVPGSPLKGILAPTGDAHRVSPQRCVYVWRSGRVRRARHWGKRLFFYRARLLLF